MVKCKRWNELAMVYLPVLGRCLINMMMLQDYINKWFIRAAIHLHYFIIYRQSPNGFADTALGTGLYITIQSKLPGFIFQ